MRQTAAGGKSQGDGTLPGDGPAGAGRRARRDERGTGLLGRGRHLLQRPGAGNLRAEVQKLRTVRILSVGEAGRGCELCPVCHIADEVSEMS